MSNPKQVEQTIEIEDEPVLDSPMINSLSESQIAETHSELERQPITELIIDLQTDIVKCQKELEIYRNKDEIVKDEINQIRLNLRKYRTMMEQRVEENKNKCKNKARETKSRVTVMLSKLKTEIDDMEVLNNNLRELLTKEKNQIEQLKVEIDDLNVHTDEVERMLVRKDRQIDFLNNWIKEFEKTYTSMKARYHAIQTENSRCVQLKGHVRLSHLDDVSLMADNYDNLQQMIETLQGKLKEKDPLLSAEKCQTYRQAYTNNKMFSIENRRFRSKGVTLKSDKRRGPGEIPRCHPRRRNIVAGHPF
ncbi:hypothetical protein ACOME3_002319 [Neoechinorhynchus agilis]